MTEASGSHGTGSIDGTSASRRSLRTAPRAHLIALTAMMAGYVVVAVVLGYLRLLEFTATNWDLGIFQQSLWTAAHGQTFFAAGNWESSGAVSFLQVHPALLLYLLVPIYAAAPSPVTLLIVQAVVVAGAAVPIYQIGRRLLRTDRRALVLAGVFLAYAPVLTSNLYDFHLEAFIPLEIFLLFLCWLDGRYRAGLIVAAFAFITLEVTPFFVAAVALYFLSAEWSHPSRSLPDAPAAGAGSRPSFRHRLREWLRHRPVRWSLALLGVAAVAYILLRVFEWWVLPAALGVPPGVPPGVTGLGGVASSSGLGLSFAWGYSLALKIGFWITLVALLGFLPVFAPRAWILALPWLFFTFQADKIAWVVFGFQYGFLAMTPMVLAALLGLRNLETTLGPLLVARLRGVAARRPAVGRLRRLAGPRVRRSLVVAGLVVLVAANLYLTPANPLQQNVNSSLSGYRVSYTVPPGYADVVQAAQLVPANAPILASDNLFVFVANNPNAYSFLWVPRQPTYLPFDVLHLPEYVFLASSQQYAVPSWLVVALSNQSLYGLRAHVPSTPAGSVSLWERGYAGPVAVVAGDPAPPSGGPTTAIACPAPPLVARPVGDGPR